MRLLMCRWIKLESKRALILPLFLFITLFFIFFLLLFLFYFMSLSFVFFFLALSLFLLPVPAFISFSFPVLLQNTFLFPDLLHVYVPVLVCLNPKSLGEGGISLTPHLSICLALNFCSLTDCKTFWYNCSLFVNTSFDTNKVTPQMMTSSQRITQFLCVL